MSARGGSVSGPPRVFSGLVAALALALGACAGPRQPHPELLELWGGYEALAPERAIAVAGSLRQARWVAGMSGGHATRVEAETLALRECQRRRLAQRMRDACRVYAVGDEIVDTRE